MSSWNVNILQDKIKALKEQLSFAETELKEATKDMIWCKSCGKYLEEKNIMHGQYKETVRGELVYQDCGYGDDDEFADVTYLVSVQRCPYCGGELKKDKIFIKEENRHGRYQ